MEKKFNEETIPNAFNNLEELLKMNNDGKGFFVGDSVSQTLEIF